jgi:hypothetical protein
MPDAIDKILDQIKAFNAENASLEKGDDDGQGFPTVGPPGHADCYKGQRESMKILIKIWKKKVAALKTANDPNPEYNAAKALQASFKGVSTELQACLKRPGHKWDTSKMGGILTKSENV